VLQIAGLRGGKFVSIPPLLEYQVGEGIAPNIFGGFGLESLWNQGSLLRFWARLLTAFCGFGGLRGARAGLPAHHLPQDRRCEAHAVGDGGEEPRTRPADVVPGQSHGADDGCRDHQGGSKASRWRSSFSRALARFISPVAQG